ncbi:MAG: type II secretion system minor pseudopilin GspK [Desulfobulbaceae bacterium]|nr:type II secretion system minor pseudopilin GspK [Desulfobulbaceae bacterium]
MRRHNQKGMALVLTLMAVSFMVAITVQVATSVNWQMQGAGNLRDSVQLDAMNRSGLSLVRAALHADLQEDVKKNQLFDSSHDSWNKMGSEDAPDLFGNEKLHVSVTDLSGLLQVNALVPDEKDQEKFNTMQDKQREIWRRFLDPEKFAVADSDEAGEIIDAIIDWIDENDLVRDHGAESGYYLSLSPSYKPRNAPFSYPEELLLIRGMTKDLFYGNEDYLGLGQFVTVAGRDGAININTAPAEVLMALEKRQNMSDETAQDLIDFRAEESNMAALADPQWYKQVNGSLELEETLAVVQSRYFKIEVTAEHNTMARSGAGILERDRETSVQKLLYWEVR